MMEFKIKASIDIVIYAEDEAEFNEMAGHITDDSVGDSIEYSFPSVAYALATIESSGLSDQPT